jgi:diketogulonate reductase-like aldo/keto reductase
VTRDYKSAVSDSLRTRRSLGSTALSVCPLALGTMQFGWTASDVDSMKILDAYYEAGGNLFDTANMYGGDQSVESFTENRAHVGVSEDILGRWLHDRGVRQDVVVTTKVRARMWEGPDGEGLNRTSRARSTTACVVCVLITSTSYTRTGLIPTRMPRSGSTHLTLSCELARSAQSVHPTSSTLLGSAICSHR